MRLCKYVSGRRRWRRCWSEAVFCGIVMDRPPPVLQQLSAIVAGFTRKPAVLLELYIGTLFLHWSGQVKMAVAVIRTSLLAPRKPPSPLHLNKELFNVERKTHNNFLNHLIYTRMFIFSIKWFQPGNCLKYWGSRENRNQDCHSNPILHQHSITASGSMIKKYNPVTIYHYFNRGLK